MELYTSEEQQVQAIKDWWEKYQRMLIGSVFAVIIGYFGWQFYHSEQQKSQEQQASAYASLMEHAANDPENALSLYADFTQTYAGTIYADLVHLATAAKAVETDDFETAKTALQSVIDNKSSQEIISLAAIRLARIELAQGQFDQALGTLEKLKGKPSAFTSEKQEVLSDIFLAQGKPQLAREALDAIPEEEKSNNPFLQLKIDNLAPLQQTDQESTDDAISEE